MRLLRKTNEFRVREDGSLLVFFVISLVAILGIVALSFDMGRRASTQTDMQSFVDNVTLAAAGELDGSANAIVNATQAANTAIVAANEQLKAGASGQNFTLSLAQIVFYGQLPASDTPGSFTVANLQATKYTLPPSDLASPPDPTQAVYVGVRLNTVNVNWMFANIFGGNLTLNGNIGAVAIAGNSAWTCDIAPLMFCLPQAGSPLSPVALQPGWGVQLRTARHNAAWGPGDFGFLNISAIPNAASGPCTGGQFNNEARKQACLLARGIGACFKSRTVDVQPGQRNGLETAAFNVPFGLFLGSMSQLESDPAYAAGPHVISGQNHGGNGNQCRILGPSGNTEAFPPDNCHLTSSCTYGRFGNGAWDRTTYVNTNYGFTKPNGTAVPGSFFDFPEGNLTRYQYYQREIERAANGGVMNAAGNGPYANAPYITDNDGQGESINQYSSWDDYWGDSPSGLNPIIPSSHTRQDDGLPQCSTLAPTANANRRVVIAAGIDCNRNPINGNTTVPVHQYYRVFQLAPALEISNTGGQGPIFDIWVEIIEPVGGQAGASTIDNGIFREVIQLYR